MPFGWSRSPRPPGQRTRHCNGSPGPSIIGSNNRTKVARHGLRAVRTLTSGTWPATWTSAGKLFHRFSTIWIWKVLRASRTSSFSPTPSKRVTTASWLSPPSMSTTTEIAPSLTEQSIEILEHTRDGDDLEPFHLSLLQAAVNNHLTARGVETFQRLYATVTSGQYAKPWLAGVEHVTRDHQGYVYWKGSRIEHFTFSVMTENQLRATTQRLAERCRHIEALGLPVCGRSYFNDWLQEMPLDFPHVGQIGRAHV